MYRNKLSYVLALRSLYHWFAHNDVIHGNSRKFQRKIITVAKCERHYCIDWKIQWSTVESMRKIIYGCSCIQFVLLLDTESQLTSRRTNRRRRCRLFIYSGLVSTVDNWLTQKSKSGFFFHLWMAFVLFSFLFCHLVLFLRTRLLVHFTHSHSTMRLWNGCVPSLFVVSKCRNEIRKGKNSLAQLNTSTGSRCKAIERTQTHVYVSEIEVGTNSPKYKNISSK